MTCVPIPWTRKDTKKRETKALLDPAVIMHRTHWHRQLWISALECKQTTETMTQDDNAEVKIDLNNCCLNTAFTMMRFISCEPCSSVQIIIAQCTRHVQSWHTCFFLRTCFFFTWQRMRRNWCFPQLTKRRTTSQPLQPLRDHCTNRMITVHKNGIIWMPCKQ